MTIAEIYQLFIQSTGVCTDTRNIKENSLFFALKGDNFNANQFAESALEKGAAYVIADEKLFLENSKIIIVDNVLETLQKLAQHHRTKFTFPVIGLTGSNGKTTTKELIASVLKQQFKTHCTQGNLNNHIGVPLTLLSTPLDAEMLIVEMGANHQGEIKLLSEIANPDFGLISNIGKAHLEGFGGVEGVKKGKTELYRHLNNNGGSVFFNNNEGTIAEFENAVLRPIKYGKETIVSLLKINSEKEFLEFDMIVDGNKINLCTHLFGEYNVNNVLTAVAIGNYFKVSLENIKKGVEAYQPNNNRSQVEVSTKGNKLVLDAYNANPTSLSNALNQFAKVSDESSYIIIGDMLELGEYTNHEHLMVLNQLKNIKGTKMLVGKFFYEFKNEFNYHFYMQVSDLIPVLNERQISGALVLIKGSRGVALEKVVPCL